MCCLGWRGCIRRRMDKQVIVGSFFTFTCARTLRLIWCTSHPNETRMKRELTRTETGRSCKLGLPIPNRKQRWSLITVQWTIRKVCVDRPEGTRFRSRPAYIQEASRRGQIVPSLRCCRSIDGKFYGQNVLREEGVCTKISTNFTTECTLSRCVRAVSCYKYRGGLPTKDTTRTTSSPTAGQTTPSPLSAKT